MYIEEPGPEARFLKFAPFAGMLPQVRQVERVAALLMGFGLLAYSQVPTLWAERAEVKGYYPDKVYTGALPTYFDDTGSYWSWMRQARDGRFFLNDLYTPEDHPRNYVNLLFWGLGRAARATGLEIEVVYVLARVFFGAILIWILYLLACRLFVRPGERIACYFAFLLAGGWEGTSAFLERHAGWPHVTSPAWWTPEMSTFFSLMLFPHFLAGFVGMLSAVLITLRVWSPDIVDAPRGQATIRGLHANPPRESLAPRAPRKASRLHGIGLSLATGLVLFIVTFFHPYDVVTVMAMLWISPLLFAVSERRWPWREWRHSLIATLVWIPAFLYNLWIFMSNPAMRWWDLQNIMETPEPSRLLVAFGVNAIAAALCLLALRRLRRPHLVMLAWLLSTLVIIHLPLRFQRRTIGGIQFPLAALATAGIAYVVVPRLFDIMRRSLAIVRAVRWLPSSGIAATLARVPRRGLGLATLGITGLLAPLQFGTPYYLHDIEWSALRTVRYPAWLRSEDYAALHALERIAPPGSIVLSSYEMGNFVPPYAGLRCFIGHYALTIDAATKREEAARFFSEPDDQDGWRLDFLRRWRIRYILWTPFERALGRFDPPSRPWLEEVYSAGTQPEVRSIIYRVRLPEPEMAQGPSERHELLRR